MYYYRLPYILFRDYPEHGYLSDNRHFGYDTATSSSIKVGDRLISKSGSIFYSMLTDCPQSSIEMAKRAATIFEDVPLAEINQDLIEFFSDLADDGFIGRTYDSSHFDLPIIFSYSNTKRFDFSNKLSTHVEMDHRPQTEYYLQRVHLCISGICNEDCIHCYFPKDEKRGLMSKELFDSIIKQCRELNVLNITISGGEPMLNPLFIDFIKTCGEYNFSINILSNLSAITDSMIDEFSRNPLISIQTSLYSMNEDIHDRITTRKGSFKKTKEAILKLHKRDIPLHINCPIMKDNFQTYKSVLDWARFLNIGASSDYMLFGCYDSSCSNLNCRLEHSEITSIIQSEYDYSMFESEKRQSYGPDSKICPVGTSSICISWDGSAYPCEGWQQYTVGDIRSQSLSSIWKDSEQLNALRALRLKDFQTCLHCNNNQYCSICLIRNANESISRDFKEINRFFCSIAEMKRLKLSNL